MTDQSGQGLGEALHVNAPRYGLSYEHYPIY